MTSTRGRAWTRGRRRTVIGVLSALMAGLMVAGSVAGSAFLSMPKPRFTVDFHVDVGCIPMEVMNLSPVKDFFASDIASVRMLRRGTNYAWSSVVNRNAGAVELSQSGWSSVYVGSAKVREGEEIGFALVNDAGEAIFESAVTSGFPTRAIRERDVPETRRRGRGGCTKIVSFRKRSTCESSTACLDLRRRGPDVFDGARLTVKSMWLAPVRRSGRRRQRLGHRRIDGYDRCMAKI